MIIIENSCACETKLKAVGSIHSQANVFTQWPTGSPIFDSDMMTGLQPPDVQPHIGLLVSKRMQNVMAKNVVCKAI